MAVVPLRTVDDTTVNFEHPLYKTLLSSPGLSVGVAALDDLLTWGLTNALWVFPMATSCCGIELMAAMASRVDMDRMGSFTRATPRQADVMVVAGTITTKMAPRVKKLWEQMPEPKWCVAMGSCAISGDFYRNLYPTVPGIDTFLPVDVYIPGCPPNPESLMHGLLRLADKVRKQRTGEFVEPDHNPALLEATRPSVPRLGDPARPAELDAAQEEASLDPTGAEITPALVVEGPAAEPAPVSNGADADAVLSEFGVKELPKEGPPVIAVAQHVALATRLKQIGYRQLVTVVATHWAAGTGRKGKDAAETEHLEVAYVLRKVGQGSSTATWAVRLGAGEPVPSLARLFAGADWQEREQYDLVGVPFAGHPDLRRLMMTENTQTHPLRRDFPADAPCAPWR